MYRWLAWNLFFPVHEFLKGHPTLAILKEMEEADLLSPACLQAVTTERLRELVEYCYAHVPYWRARLNERGLGPADIREVGDLQKLPLTRKADARAHREALRSDVARKLVPMATGGSTGEPLIFDLAKRRIAARVACRQRVSRWWGLSAGDSEVAVWGSPVELTRQDRLRGIRDWLLATRLLPAFEMDEATMSRYIDLLQTLRPRQVFGYPSALYLLCLEAQKRSKPMRHLGVKVVFVTGEVLLPHQRVAISQTFGCPVADGYGGRDSGFIAHECPQGGMHILSDAVVVEIVDPAGRPVVPGGRGEIVVTDLYSHEAPFLRYATGDVGIISTRSCACGRPLPLLERIEGRANDAIVAPDGRVINSLALIYPVREVPGIERFRICQQAVAAFHVDIVSDERFPADGEARIRLGWARLLRSPIRVTFRHVRSLPPDPSGKFRHVVSELSLGKGLGSCPHSCDKIDSPSSTTC